MTSAFRLSSPHLRYFAWLLDALILLFFASISAQYYLGDWHYPFDLSTVYAQILLMASLILGVFSDRIYRSWRINDLWSVLGTVSWTWLLVMLLLTFYLFLTKSSVHVSRIWFLIWGVSCWVALIFQRSIVYLILHWLRRQGYNFRTVLLIGVGSISDRVLDAIDGAAWSGVRILGVIRPDELDKWLQFSGTKEPSEIWICLPMSDESGIRQSLNSLRHSFANIRLIPDVFSFRLVNHGVSYSLGMPMFDLSMSPISGPMRILKAIEDIVLSLIIVPMILPVMLSIALAIKLTSHGPVLYKQKRLGWNGAEITVYKFRTMVHTQASAEVFEQAQVNDKRITRIGRFLRRTSLDELPQFINVLQGRMSIVGPRPHAIAHNEQFKELVPRYMLRHKVKPGITGWAQIHGYRGETDTIEKMESRVEHDLYYIENMSLWLDLQIIIMTIFKGFVHKNAY